jgi:hypothetical protein
MKKRRTVSLPLINFVFFFVLFFLGFQLNVTVFDRVGEWGRLYKSQKRNCK